MLKFIGAQVYQHQDDVIVEMGLPTVESHNPSPITPSTSNLNIVENGNLIELVTDPNSTIRIQHGNSGWSFTANERGRTNISQLENGVYLVSVNNSEPEPVVLAKAEDYDWMSYQYYAPDNYLIHIDRYELHGYMDKWVGLYDAEGNELYSTIIDRTIDYIDITYTMEDSPGLLEPGQYRMTATSISPHSPWVQDFTLESDSNTYILSFRYNNYLGYNIRIGAPRGSQVYLHGPINKVYDIGESLSVSLVSEGWGPDLPDGLYTIFYTNNGMISNPVNLQLISSPFRDVKLEDMYYYNSYIYHMWLSGEPFSRVVVGGVEYPESIPADGWIKISALRTNIKLYSGEIYEIYTYNRDWKSNTIRLAV